MSENIDRKKQDFIINGVLKAWLDITYEESETPVTEKKIINQSKKTLALINKNLKF